MKRILPFLVLLLLLLPTPAMADIAPPDQPPGANPVPGSSSTHVRMLSENVLIEVQLKAPPGSLGQARVTASFTMRNLGSASETMAVRFPLSFWDGSSNGFGDFPEIRDFSAKVGGKVVPTLHTTSDKPNDSSQPLPWAEFQATFPPGQDILVEVAYVVEGAGEYPFISFKYIVETGAGWQDSIGSADIVLRLPYEADHLNVIVAEQIGWSETSPGGTFSGREVRWHIEEFEPTRENNIQVALVMPSAWQKVLDERARVTQDPNDGEAWGRLGKIYKEIASLRRGLRQDAGGQELYRLSVEAYEKALARLPDDALWHAGFADLLYRRYYWGEFFTENPDHTDMLHALDEIRISLELDPDNPKAIELLDDMRYALPEAVRQDGSGYQLLWLTATPTARPTYTATPSDTPAPTEVLPSLTYTPSLELVTAVETRLPTKAAEPTQALTPENPAPTSNPSPGFPFCGAALLLPLAAAGWLSRRGLRFHTKI